MKVRDAIKMIERDGWVHIRTRSSHRHYRHSSKPGTVTVPGNGNHDLHPKTLGSILKQAGLNKEEPI
jgi:predicted RNA binding protein YcfA (HicA-like mRNA interferase family)